MTRAERLAQQEARATARLAEDRKQLARVQAARKAAEQQARRSRWLAVGQLADQAGLLAWDDATLAAVFQTLARLGDCPHPAAVLDGLLDPQLTGPLVSGNGYAHPADGVAPDGASGTRVH
jgi:hypothetical protein